jgi:hypothetical protein
MEMMDMCKACKTARRDSTSPFCGKCGTPFNVGSDFVANPLAKGEEQGQENVAGKELETPKVRKRTMTQAEAAVDTDGLLQKRKVGARTAATLLEVDEVNSVFTVDLELYMQWKQPELMEEDAIDAFIPGGESLGILKPSSVLIAYKTSDLIEETYWVNKATGDVCCLFNWLVSFREPMELQTFPFDRQCFTMTVQGNDVDFCGWDLAEEEMPDDCPATTMEIITQLDLWKLYKVKGELDGSYLIVTALAERNPKYYGVNVLAVMFLIVISNGLCYGVPVHDTVCFFQNCAILTRLRLT